MKAIMTTKKNIIITVNMKTTIIKESENNEDYYNSEHQVRSGDRYEQECDPEFGQAVFCR